MTRALPHLGAFTPATQRRPALEFLPGLVLARDRLHEFCGPARRTLALWAARGCEGAVVWIGPWRPDGALCPAGIHPFIEPGRLILAAGKTADEQLWAAEEALRSGAVGLVVADLAEAPGLTPVRRLHLAAGEGAEAARHLGLVAVPGLLLLPGDGGAPGVESRWYLAPRHRAGESEWQLERRRARGEPPAAWRLTGAPERPHLTPAPSDPAPH